LALWRAQYPEGLVVDVGLLTYPATFNDTTKHGWPACWLLRNKHGETFVPGSTRIDYSVLPWNLAVDLAAWFAVVMATAHLSWRMSSSRGRFSLRFLFSVTTAVAILLAWWRLEYDCCIIKGNPELSALLRMDPETPMLRMLQFPPGVCIPLLLSTGCVILCAIDVTFYILAQAQTRWRDLLGRTANKGST
jgi:hypothetical protein